MWLIVRVDQFVAYLWGYTKFARLQKRFNNLKTSFTLRANKNKSYNIVNGDLRQFNYFTQEVTRQTHDALCGFAGEHLSHEEHDIDRALRPLSFDDFNGQPQVLENLEIFVAAANELV